MFNQMHAKSTLSIIPSLTKYPDGNHQIMTLTVPVGIYLQIMTADTFLYNFINRFSDVMIGDITEIYEPNPNQWEFPNAKFKGENDHRPGEGSWEDLFRDTMRTYEQMCNGIHSVAFCDRIRQMHMATPDYDERILPFITDWGKDKMRETYDEEQWIPYVKNYLHTTQGYPSVITTIARNMKDVVFKGNEEKAAYYQGLIDEIDQLTEKSHQMMGDIHSVNNYLRPLLSLCTFTISFNQFKKAVELAYRFRGQLSDDKPIVDNPIEDQFIREFIGIITGEVPMG